MEGYYVLHLLHLQANFYCKHSAQVLREFLGELVRCVYNNNSLANAVKAAEKVTWRRVGSVPRWSHGVARRRGLYDLIVMADPNRVGHNLKPETWRYMYLGKSGTHVSGTLSLKTKKWGLAENTLWALEKRSGSATGREYANFCTIPAQ